MKVIRDSAQCESHQHKPTREGCRCVALFGQPQRRRLEPPSTVRDMVTHRMSFQQRNSLLFTQIPQNFAYARSQLPIDYCPSAFSE